MILFSILTALLIFIADIADNYWHIEYTPYDVSIIIGKGKKNDI